MPAVADLRGAFRDLPVVHVASLLPSGAPHVVPLWFVWLEEGIYLTARRESRVARNLTRDPRVALSFDEGRAWVDQSGVVVTGVAEDLPPEHAGAKRATSAWFEKYRAELGGTGFAVYTEQVPDPVLFRVRPDHLATWSHAEEGG